jgi:hypothetical protein
VLQSLSAAEWKARYRAAAEALAQVDVEELAALTDEEALRRTLSLSCFTDERLPASEWSGLVEQQVLFNRINLR